MIRLDKYQAVIFDMDGVLIDSEPLWKIAMEEVFTEVGCAITREDFQKTVGLRIDEVVEFWCREKGWSHYSCEEVEQRIIHKMIDLIHAHGKPLPGVLETLKVLQERGVKTGLATSSYAVLIDAVLSTLKIQNYFHQAHSAEHEAYGQPHPAVYLHTAAMLEVKPDRCLVIEDSFNGILSGLSAKMEVVCIPEKTHTPDPRVQVATYHFEDMIEFLKAIK
jgi:sugar-phosphatase